MTPRNPLKPISCAECRRLKLKCDRVFPCSSCRKRGCGAICPNGSLPTRPRAVFQETERLKNRITSLTDRVHELESALGQMHSHITPEGPHPLLSADLLALSREAEDNEKEQVAKRQGPGFGHEGDNAGKADEDVPESGKEDEVTEIKEGLGTLTLHSDGRSRFYGPTAGIESLFHSDLDDNDAPEAPTCRQFPSSIGPGPPPWPQEDYSITSQPAVLNGQASGSTLNSDLASTNPASSSKSHPISASILTPNWFAPPLPTDRIIEVMVSLECHLPNPETAMLLSETYFEHAAWLHSCIPRNEFFSDIFSRIYHPDHPDGSLTHSLQNSSAACNIVREQVAASDVSGPVLLETAAILFMALAIGCLLDLNVPANHPPSVAQAELYHELACAALGAAGVVERGSLRSVQCLMVMAYYYLVLDKPYSSQRCWALIGISVKVSQAIGLHRDSAWWNRNPADVQRRRDVFWELFSFETLQCMTLGLPPSLSLRHVDCEYLEDSGQRVNETGDLEHSFLWMKRKWTRECVSEVADTLLLLSKKPVPYATILSLDRKLRDDLCLHSADIFSDAKQDARNSYFTGPKISCTMQRIINILAREALLLLLHRQYLARALHSSPKNIFSSKYGPSVLASYRSACHLVTLYQTMASTKSALPPRLWFLWNNLLGVSIVLAALATRNPWCTIAPESLAQLDATYRLCEYAAESGGTRPAQVLAIVGRLRGQAHRVLDNIRKKDPQLGTTPEVVGLTPEDMSILSGGGGVKEVPKRQHTQSTMATLPQPSTCALNFAPKVQIPSDVGSMSAGSSPGNKFDSPDNISDSPGHIFETLHPDLMEDLRSTNKLNEAKLPSMNWDFSELTSRNDVQPVLPAYQPPTTLYFSNSFGQNNLLPTPSMGVGPTDAWSFDPTSSSVMERSEMAASGGNFGMVTGGGAYDTSWQRWMDQLGVNQVHMSD